MKPSSSLAPQKFISQNHAQSPPIRLSVLRLTVHTGLISLWNVHLWVAKSPSSLRSSVLQDLGYDVLSLHVIVQENMCHVALDHGVVHGST